MDRGLAEALEEAYTDLFQVRRDAQNMKRDELKGKIKTLTQGQYTDLVVDRMATTFNALAAAADWEAPKQDPPPADTPDRTKDEVPPPPPPGDDNTPPRDSPSPPGDDPPPIADGIKLGGFVYNIELHLPESRDPAVYEALFRSLKAHLLS